MFATLHYNPGDEEMTFEAVSDKPPSLNQPFSHSACFSCRDKKLKCTGEKSGCERCRKRDIVCEYAPTSSDAGTEKRKIQRPESPRPNSPTGSSSKKDPSLKEKVTTKEQKDDPSTQPVPPPLDTVTVQGHDTISMSGLSNIPMSSDSNLTVTPSSTGLPFPQMPLPDFTMSDLTMDDMLDSTFEIPGFDADFNLLDPKINWQHSGTTPADINSIAPVLTSSEQPHTLLNSTQTQRSSSNFRIRDDRRDTPQRSRSPKSETPPTPRTDSTSVSLVVCSCRDTALRILEVLQPQRMRKPNQAVLQQLHFTKNIINQCQEIIQCATCIKVSSLMALVCVISENLVDVFESVMQDWESKSASPGTGRDAQKPALHARTMEGVLLNADGQDYSFGDYRVDTVEEWLSMTACLLLFQINRLDSILTALQKNAVTADWESQLIILQPVFQRLKGIKNKL